MSSCFSVKNLCRHYIFWVIYVSGFVAAVKTFSTSGPVFINSWHRAEPFVFTGAYLWSELFFKNIAAVMGGRLIILTNPVSVFSFCLNAFHWIKASSIEDLALQLIEQCLIEHNTSVINLHPCRSSSSLHLTPLTAWHLCGCAHSGTGEEVYFITKQLFRVA